MGIGHGTPMGIGLGVPMGKDHGTPMGLAPWDNHGHSSPSGMKISYIF
jgi:hypothetical protein